MPLPSLRATGCILSKFYIKPQLRLERELARCSCILSKFYIKPQPRRRICRIGKRCILSKFYIKPQLQKSFPAEAELYLIEILHQTTTFYIHIGKRILLYLIEILHQTTTFSAPIVYIMSCILSKFYIKPQHERPPPVEISVVSYRNSTSNHNSVFAIKSATPVVSYRNSTSNHNGVNATMSGGSVVSYRNSTSNHNLELQITEHNVLYLIEILHQTTTMPAANGAFNSCILSKFYIKPQHGEGGIADITVVSYRNSTSNHNALPPII